MKIWWKIKTATQLINLIKLNRVYYNFAWEAIIKMTPNRSGSLFEHSSAKPVNRLSNYEDGLIGGHHDVMDKEGAACQLRLFNV